MGFAVLILVISVGSVGCTFIRIGIGFLTVGMGVAGWKFC